MTPADNGRKSPNEPDAKVILPEPRRVQRAVFHQFTPRLPRWGEIAIKERSSKLIHLPVKKSLPASLLFRRLHLWVWPCLVLARAAAQTISYSGGTLAENFDSLGPNGTNTPPGWFAGWSGPGVSFTTNITVGNGSVAPTSAAGWNFGATGAANRALGVAATGSRTPTPPGTNRFLEVRIRNATPAPIPAIHVRYDGEEWRTRSSSSVVNSNALPSSARTA